MRFLVMGVWTIAAMGCGEGPCPSEGLPPCGIADEPFLTVSDPLEGVAVEGDWTVSVVCDEAVTVEQGAEVVVLPVAGALDVSEGDTLTLVETPGSGGVELLRGGRFVGFVGRLADQQAPGDWVVEVGALEVELEPVCIRDTGARSWCDGGDDPSRLVYAARVGGVVVPPGESRTGTINGATATVRNRGINAPLDCDDVCSPIQAAQLGLDVAVAR